MADALANEYVRTHQISRRIHDEAKTYFSGDGATHVMRMFHPFRPYITHAQGSRKWDVDGNEYVDYIMGHGALILGHSHPVVVRAVQEQMARGVHFGENSELEVELARLIREMFPLAERVEYCSSGQEANLLALRLSRLFTGRRKILRFIDHYHGWADELAPGGSPGVRGDEVMLISSNNLERVEKELASREYAALIMEGGGGILGVQTLLERNFVCSLQDLTHKYGTVWVCDEVVTGFRSSPGGWQSLAGIKPDLTTLGKCLAGGLPIGAVVGRANIMNVLSSQTPPDKRMEHGGTWNALPLVCAAGIAACKMYRTGEPQQQAHAAAASFIEKGLGILKGRRIAGRLRGGSIVKLDLESHRTTPKGIDPALKSDITDLFNSQAIPVRARLCLHLLQRGVATLEGSFFIFSAAHTKSDVNLSLDALSDSLDAMIAEGIISTG